MSNNLSVRIIGDPVLRQVAEPVTNIDGALAGTTEKMLETMYAEPGIGLAAPQVGIGLRYFVYDLGEGDGPKTLVNPEIVESRGEWVYAEGCLSVPGLFWEITRPKEIHIKGYDLEGNEVSIEADELEARLFQHELDHLDAVLLVDHISEEERKEAMKVLNDRKLSRHIGKLFGKEPESDSGLTLP